jgi:hypothetical protein
VKFCRAGWALQSGFQLDDAAAGVSLVARAGRGGTGVTLTTVKRGLLVFASGVARIQRPCARRDDASHNNAQNSGFAAAATLG